MMFGDVPFGWFKMFSHDREEWTATYVSQVCVAAYSQLAEDGVLLIRYAGWNPNYYSNGMRDAGFHVPHKQPHIVVQAENFANSKSYMAFGGSVNIHFQYLVGYESRDTAKQYMNLKPFGLIKSTVRGNTSMMTGLPQVPQSRKLVNTNGEVVRPQQMSLEEAVELVHRYCPPGGLVVDFCCGTMRTAMACVLLGRPCVMNDRDTEMVDLAAKDVIDFMYYRWANGDLKKLGMPPTYDGTDPFAPYLAECARLLGRGKPVRSLRSTVPAGGQFGTSAAPPNGSRPIWETSV